jgi:hypothetical protein
MRHPVREDIAKFVSNWRDQRQADVLRFRKVDSDNRVYRGPRFRPDPASRTFSIEAMQRESEFTCAHGQFVWTPCARCKRDSTGAKFWYDRKYAKFLAYVRTLTK